QIDAIEQRPGNSRSVTGDLIWRAPALAASVAQVTAGAWIHRRDELEACRKRRLTRGARNMDLSGFERLAQYFEHSAIPLGKLVKEQHAMVSERNLAGPRIASSANESHGRGGV